MPVREHNIQNEIRLWCGTHGILCFRCNVGKVLTATGDYFETGLPVGFSDLIILYNKTIYFCEVKTLKGKQRQCQVDFMNMIRSYGYTYFVARCVDDVIRGLGYGTHDNDN